MDQSSEQWHAWRGKGIGSSDAPIILGVSPYLTKYQLWLEKTGAWKRPDAGFAAGLGTHFESAARARFNLMHDMDVKPGCVEHKEFSYMRASLDGADMNQRVFVEIKYMGKKNFDLCKTNRTMIDHHIPQVQHQFIVTGFERAFYIPYTLTEDKKQISEIEFIPITPDRDYIEKTLAPAEQEFWRQVVDQVPPELTDDDEKMCKEKYYVDIADNYVRTKSEIKLLELHLSQYEEELKKVSDHPIVNFNNRLKIVRSFRKGNVDYGMIPQLKGLNLDSFRKPPSSIISFKPMADKK